MLLRAFRTTVLDYSIILRNAKTNHPPSQPAAGRCCNKCQILSPFSPSQVLRASRVTLGACCTPCVFTLHHHFYPSIPSTLPVSVLMPHVRERSSEVTNHDTRDTHCKYNTMSWPCNANRNERAGNKRKHAKPAHQTICGNKKRKEKDDRHQTH